MLPKFIIAGDVSIAYIEKNSEAENTIVFIHGNSSSTKIWSEQFISPVLNNFRLIALDLPAHGSSSSFSETGYDYSLPAIASVMTEAIGKICGNRNYILAGLSLGTNIVAEMLACAIQPAGLIIMGSCMLGSDYGMEKVFMPGIDMHAAFTDEVSEDELTEYWKLAGVSASDMNKYKLFAEDYRAVKDNFRSQMFASVGEGKISDQVSLLEKKNIPSLIIFGDDELVCNKNYLDGSSIKMWNDKVYKLAGAGHLVPLDKPGELNELINHFASDIFKSVAAGAQNL